MMIDSLIIFPIVLHLLLAIILLFCWQKIQAQKIISMAGSLLGIGVAAFLFAKVFQGGIITMQGGGWQAPFGISFIADTFSSTMILLASIASAAVTFFSVASIKKPRMQFGYFPSLHFLIMGLNGAFLTGDMFNLYVWFEVIIISSFVFITLGGKKIQIEASVKYFTLNFLGSMIFLTAIAILYGLTGSLNMADLAGKIFEVDNQLLVQLTAILFLVGFGIKSAIFPLYFWLPDSYHTPQAAIASIFSGLLTKVGVYALLRVFSLIFIPGDFMKNLLVILAVLTLVSAALGAMVQVHVRRTFSYLIICHIGFMIGGLGMFTLVALTAAVFYLIHDIIVKTNLFLVAGLVYKFTGEVNMKKMGGIYQRSPVLAWVMAIPLFSMVGVPPLSGFWPKIGLLKQSFATGNYWLLGAIIFASFVTLFIIARFWSEAFWKKNEGPIDKPYMRYWWQLQHYEKSLLAGPVIFLALVSLYIGLGAEHINIIAMRIAADLVDTAPYIDAVLKR